MGLDVLIVDFGGVLTTSVWDSFGDFCEQEGLPRDRIRQLFRDDPDALADLRGLETGEVDPPEFERRFAERLGVDADGLIGRLFAGLGADERVAGAVRSARSAGRPTALISNSWGSEIYDADQLDELFDEVVISGEVGLHKPQPEIYRLACERLGVDAGRCVFVDDLRENCEGAEAVGMTAVLHRDTEETVRQIERLLGLSLD